MVRPRTRPFVVFALIVVLTACTAAPHDTPTAALTASTTPFPRTPTATLTSRTAPVLATSTPVLTACAVPLLTTPIAAPSLDGTPTAGAIDIPKGSGLFLPADKSVPTMANPVFDLALTVVDLGTREAVTNAVITINGRLIYHGSQLTVRLSAQENHIVAVDAPGYEHWEVKLEPRLRRYQQLELPALLRPLPVASGPEARVHGLARPAPTICNRPLPPFWPPDGCGEYTPVAAPIVPLPAPCLIAAKVVTEEDGTRLIITVAHPEIRAGVSTVTVLARAGLGWYLVGADWKVNCGWDEGPLVGATLAALNGDLHALARSYAPALPVWRVVQIAALAGDSGASICRWPTRCESTNDLRPPKYARRLELCAGENLAQLAERFALRPRF